jgi:hypothetical protein
MIYLLIIPFLLIHYYFGNHFQNRILNTAVFTNRQKRIHILLIWILPFFWFWLIKGLIKPTEIMTKDKRKIDKSSFHESGIGQDIPSSL